MDAERELELEIDAGRARYLFRKEHDLRVALEARVAELEAVLEEAEIEVSVAAHRLHFEDIAQAPDRANELADLCERLRDALKGKQNDA